MDAEGWVLKMERAVVHPATLPPTMMTGNKKKLRRGRRCDGERTHRRKSTVAPGDYWWPLCRLESQMLVQLADYGTRGKRCSILDREPGILRSYSIGRRKTNSRFLIATST